MMKVYLKKLRNYTEWSSGNFLTNPREQNYTPYPWFGRSSEDLQGGSCCHFCPNCTQSNPVFSYLLPRAQLSVITNLNGSWPLI